MVLYGRYMHTPQIKKHYVINASKTIDYDTNKTELFYLIKELSFCIKTCFFNYVPLTAIYDTISKIKSEGR